MFNTKSITTSLLALAFLAQPAMAGTMVAGNVVNPHTGEHVTSVIVSSQAIDHSKAIVPLGSAFDVNGEAVEGYAIIHYKKGFGKPPWAGGGKDKGGDPAASCYSFLANGAKWKNTEPYVVASDVDAAAVARDLEAWDSQVSFNIFGNQDTVSVVDGADTSSPDGMNEVMWGDVSTDGAIAVAIVWGVFSGKPSWRYLAEWDVVFDNVDYAWGDADLDPTVMDFENIATHEFGHAVGLADLYESGCSEQTMYGYADYGETAKRTLEVGDINGVTELYK